DRTDGIADFDVARENDAVHGCNDCGVAELLLELLEAGLALQNLSASLLQLCRVDADLSLRRVAASQCGEIVPVGVIECLMADDALFLHLEVAIECGLIHGEVGSGCVYLVLLDVGLICAHVRVGSGELSSLRIDLCEDFNLIELCERLAFVNSIIDIDEE